MPDDLSTWAPLQLGQLCSFRAGSAFPPHEQGKASGDYPFIKVSDLSSPDNATEIRNARHWVDSESLDSLKAKPILAGSIVFAKIGEGLRSERIRLLTRPTLIDNNLMAATPKGHLDSRFSLYLFQTLRLSEWAAGTALPYLRQADLEQILVDIPPVSEQRRIAGVLGALDDLIDTNEKLIAKLRENQRSVYRRLSAVPNQELSFGDVASLVRERGAGGPSTLYLGLEHFAENGAGIASHGRLGDTVSQQLAFSSGDVLFGKLRPYFRKVDRPWFDGACSAEIWVLRPKPGVPSSFLHSVVDSPEFTEFAMSGSEGTRMPRAKWDHVVNFPVVLPAPNDLKRFENLGQCTWEAVSGLKSENDELRQTRDELLPLLMSGKIRVREAEELVKERVG